MAAASAVDRSFAGPGRLGGIDLARGFAVIGMLAAHLLALPDWDWADPATWGAIASGRSSILFATLAGVSVALVTGGARPLPRGPLLTHARKALAVRALFVWLLGVLLIWTGVPVYVILPAYAVLFLLAVPLLRLPAWTLWAVAGVLAVVMPLVQPVLDALPLWAGEVGSSIAATVGWHYPFTVWAAFLVAGMAAGRSDLSALRTQVWLLGAGAALAVVGYGASAVVEAAGLGRDGSYFAEVLTAAPHSSGLWEVVGSGGFALASIALCMLVCRVRVVSAVVLPLRATGSMPLTAYAGQIVVWALVATAVLGTPSDLAGMRALEPLWPFVVVTLGFCTAWALLLGRGPLESLAAWVTRRVVGW